MPPTARTSEWPYSCVSKSEYLRFSNSQSRDQIFADKKGNGAGINRLTNILQDHNKSIRDPLHDMRARSIAGERTLPIKNSFHHSMSELGFMLVCMTLAPLFQRRRAGQKSSTQPSRFLHPPRLDCNCMLYRQVQVSLRAFL